MKWIECRSRPTKYRGPVLIGAGLSETHLGRRSTRTEQRLTTFGDYTVERDRSGLLLRGPIAHPYRLPLGAVVAVADLVDCLPIVEFNGIEELGTGTPHDGPHICIEYQGTLTAFDPDSRDVDDQRPYGIFEPGMFGWVLDNVRPLRIPVPVRGSLGLTVPPDELAARCYAAADPERTAS